MFMLTVVVDENRRDAPFSSEEHALHFGALLADQNPDGFIMLNEVAEGICIHCGLPIRESLGWILYQWIHVNTQAHFCFGQDVYKAEPEVVL